MVSKHVLSLCQYIQKKDPKLNISDHVRVSKYKNIYAKEYVPNWSEEVFVIKKVKKNLFKRFTKKYCKKQIKSSLEKAINCVLNGKVATVFLIVGLIKKT